MSYQFKTTNIKGKEYVEVNQRVIAFRTLPQYKGFALNTELISLDPESCVVKATILGPDGNVLATGLAQEDKASSRINQTSYVENCETSAVGRALGFLGIGIETSIATADEVDMAIKKQNSLSSSSFVPADDYFQKAVDALKNAKKEKRQSVFDSIMQHYGDKYTPEQVESLKKIL